MRIANPSSIGFLGVFVAAFALAVNNAASDLLMVVWALFCSIGIIAAAIRMNGRARLIYGLLGVVGLLVMIGSVVRTLHGESIGIEQPLPSPADLLHVPAYLLFTLLAIGIHRIRAHRRDVDAWLDVIMIIGAAILVFWVGFLAEYLTDPAVGTAESALSTYYNLTAFVAAAVLLRNGASPGHRPVSYLLLGSAAAAFVIADIGGAVASASGATLFLAVILATIVYGIGFAAAWHPSAPEIAVRPRLEEERIGVFRYVVTAIAAATPILVSLRPQTDSTVHRTGTVILTVLIAAALLVRMLRLVNAQRRIAELESNLVGQLARLAALETRSELLAELDAAVTGVFGPDAHLSRSVQEHSEASVVLPDKLRTDSTTTEFVTLEPASDDPTRARLFASFIRDADAIASAKDAVETQARHKSEAEANRRIAANERRFRALVQNASDIVLVLDTNGIVTYMSEAVEHVLGYDAAEFVGKTPEWVSHENDWDFARGYMQAVLTGTSTNGEHELRAIHADGSVRLLEAVMTDMRHVEGIEGIVINITDATEKRALESNLRDAETTDPLTMQLNRTAFIREIDASIRRASVSESTVALAIINIDDFRMINEGYGNSTADQVLVELAYRIRQSVRLDDIVARLNGDEFGILMPNGYSAFEAEAVVERILAEVTEPVSVAGRTIALRATAGLVLNGDGSSTGIGMLRDADTALDAAKRTNRGSLVLFEEAMGTEISERVELRNLLFDAIQTNKLRLAYQPIVDMDTGEIVSMEALSRWHDKQRGNIGPATFIPIAESTGMIAELGEWALRTACSQVVTWSEMGFDGFTVSVNMSGHQLREENVISKVKSILHETNVDPTRITIEITESVLIDDTDFVADRISALRELGLRLAIDDFGTGYSSLSYLRRYEFDVLKVDRSFVVPLANDANKREREIVNAMIKLAQALGAVTVAEGIEENEEFAVLRTLGCDHAQGYLFWHPLEVEDVIDALNAAPTSQAA